ncbi:MAG: class I SAM-dependent methyltransferase [Promethearchaeota archaeon]
MKGKDIVRTGYNKIAKRYNQFRNKFHTKEELERFASILPKNAYVLDAGCGAGIPVAQYLVSKGFQVIGIDIAPGMLELARQQVPEGTFIEGDMTQLTFPDNSFDGIVSTFAIIHVPRDLHSAVYQNFYRVLKPGGILFFSTGPTEWEGTDEYLGTTMYWSHYDAETSLTYTKDAGFTILWEEIITRDGETHYWVLAQK